MNKGLINKDAPERNRNININYKSQKQYNYLKSIKDKENIIVSYYKKLSNLGNNKPKILPKPKKRTLKQKKTNININTDTEKDTEKYTDKKTKKQIVIMDD